MLNFKKLPNGLATNRREWQAIKLSQPTQEGHTYGILDHSLTILVATGTEQECRKATQDPGYCIVDDCERGHCQVCGCHMVADPNGTTCSSCQDGE